jgi:aminotransferase EvaB
MIPLNDLKRSWAVSQPCLEVFERTLNSGYWIQGKEHDSFENEFATFHDVDFAIGCASGTDAIEIALRAVGCDLGSKVITVANAGGYTTLAASRIGCTIEFCDINTSDLLIDFSYLNRILTSDVKAVVVTHLFGNVARIAEIVAICQQYGIWVIEDCAQATGAMSAGKRVGTFGDVGTFSFYPTKNLGGVGDGGALITNNNKIARRARSLRQYGWSSKYNIQLTGGKNSRLDEIQAAILRIGLPLLDELNDKRRLIVSRYSKALENSDIAVKTSTSPGSVAHLAVVYLAEGVERDKFRSHMKSRGIQTDIHYPILDYRQAALIDKSTGMHQNVFLNESEIAVSRIVSVPCFPDMTENEIEYVCDAMKEFRA